LSEVLRLLTTSGIDLIVGGDVSKLLHRAVVAGKEDEAPFLL
jgi:hypothetical protein